MQIDGLIIIFQNFENLKINILELKNQKMRKKRSGGGLEEKRRGKGRRM